MTISGAHQRYFRLVLPALIAWLLATSAPALAEIEEIVVTAQKREQNLQDVPVSVTAFTGDDIRELRITKPKDVSAQTPNLDMKNVLGNSQPVVTIRGIGLNDFVANNSQSAGLYVDEVFLVSPAQMGFQVFDTERIEVLKGPQGTLYGRNSTAGAINFVTVKPSQEFDAYAEVTAGNYDLIEVEGAIGGGSETVAGRLSFKTTQRGEGWIDNAFTGDDKYGEIDRYGIRGQVLFTPSDRADILIKGYYGEEDSDAMSNWKSLGILDGAFGPPCPSFLNTGLSNPAAGCTDLIGYVDPSWAEPFDGEWNTDPTLDVETRGIAATINIDIGSTTLTSITAYDKFERRMTEDADGSPFLGLDIVYNNRIEQWSQELRLSATTGNFDWIVGGFFSHDEVDGSPSQFFDSTDWLLTLVETRWEQETDAFALFGHAVWQFNKQWALTMGLRYTDEERDFNGSTTDLNPYGTSCLLDLICDPGFVGPFVLASTDDSISNDKWTGEVALDWVPTENVMAYGKVSTGFKSGGFPGGFTLSDDELVPYDPETLTAYEIGTKTRFAQNLVQFNAAVFYYDYEDMQVLFVPPGEITLRLTNSEGADVYGAELELWVMPVAGLDIKLGVGLLDTENKDPRMEGNDLPNSPKNTFNGLVRYSFPISDSLQASASFDFNSVSKTNKCAEDFVLCQADSYALYNARVSLGAPSGRWELALWGQNLGDEEYQTEIFHQLSLGNYFTAYGAPRTYGLTLRVGM